MSIERLGTKFALGAQIDEKFTKDKANEIIDTINDITDGTTTLTEIEVGNGTAAAPSITFTADSDTGLYRSTTNQLGVTSGGTGQVIFTDGTIEPVTNNDVDLGASGKKFKNLYIAGTSGLDSIVTFGAINTYKSATSLTALAGGAQAGTALAAEYNDFTVVATALDSAQLPTPVLGTKVIVKNSATLPMAVFPQTNAKIDSGALNASVIVGSNETVIFTATGASAWKSNFGRLDLATGVITEQVTLTATQIVGTSAGSLGHGSGAILVAGVSSAWAMEFVSAIVIYDFDTAAYTGGGNDTTINIGSGGAALTGVVTSANLIGAAGDKIVQFVPLAVSALPLSVGTGLSLNSVTAWTQPGTAAGVLRVQVSYRLHRTGL